MDLYQDVWPSFSLMVVGILVFVGMFVFRLGDWAGWLGLLLYTLGATMSLFLRPRVVV